MPCKHRRPGSIPGVSTCAIGIEEDGNLPDPESGETRFDSGGPDVTGCGVRVSAPALGAGSRGSSPCFPTCGSLVKSESRAVEAREVPGRFRGEPPRPTGVTDSASGFRPEDAGSIPAWGSSVSIATGAASSMVRAADS